MSKKGATKHVDSIREMIHDVMTFVKRVMEIKTRPYGLLLKGNGDMVNLYNIGDFVFQVNFTSNTDLSVEFYKEGQPKSTIILISDEYLVIQKPNGRIIVFDRSILTIEEHSTEGIYPETQFAWTNQGVLKKVRINFVNPGLPIEYIFSDGGFRLVKPKAGLNKPEIRLPLPGEIKIISGILENPSIRKVNSAVVAKGIFIESSLTEACKALSAPHGMILKA